MQSKLPFRKQERPYSCAVACLRMLLAHYGIDVDEATLREQCHTGETGTRAGDLVACIRDYDFDAEIQHLTVEELRSLLDEGVYPIAYIDMCPTSPARYTHTVIIEDCEDDQLLIVDPNAEPRVVKLSDFLENWQPYDVGWMKERGSSKGLAGAERIEK